MAMGHKDEGQETLSVACALRSINRWCRYHRHIPVRDQHRMLVKMVQGHYRYYGATRKRSVALDVPTSSAADVAQVAVSPLATLRIVVEPHEEADGAVSAPTVSRHAGQRLRVANPCLEALYAAEPAPGEIERIEGEPDDPGHTSCEGKTGMDQSFGGGSSYAAGVMVAMWVYKYGLFDSPAIKQDARAPAITLLRGRFCTPVSHSNPLVQALLDELS